MLSCGFDIDPIPDPCVSTDSGTSTELLRQQESLLDGGDIVRIEANFLRLPLFAVDNKHMRTMDGIRCAGSFRRGGERYDLTFQATRNVRTLYPGPIAHATHTAILSLATERGFPIDNPILFSWCELCARMGNKVNGRTVARLKDALLALKGLMIEGQHALYSKPEGRLLDAEAELNRVVGLYDWSVFTTSWNSTGWSAQTGLPWTSIPTG
ncbi:MAG: hypothetical protein AB7K24_28400 [Gemmataceae bacterium]